MPAVAIVKLLGGFQGFDMVVLNMIERALVFRWISLDFIGFQEGHVE